MFKRNLIGENKLNMKDLEKIIQENKLSFDSFEPGEGHLDRFEQKLIEFNNRKNTFSFAYILKAAVIAILVTLSGLWVYDNFDSRSDKGITLSELSPEYNEVEMYYTHLVNQKYNEIDQSQSLDSNQKIILVNELKEMDVMYENLKQDLQSNPTDKRVINAMIKHYQLKVGVMNQILDQLQQAQNINNQKSNNYESTNI
jgi:hypothetical protein